MERTTRNVGRPAAYVDPESVSLSSGRQVDWDAVTGDAGSKFIPAFTVVSETAEGKIVPRADGAAGSAFGIIVSSANENSRTDSLSGYGVAVGGGFYTELLAAGSDAFTGELGPLFWFESYEDDRGAA